MPPPRRSSWLSLGCPHPSTLHSSNIFALTRITATPSPPGSKWAPRSLLPPSNTSSYKVPDNCSSSPRRPGSRSTAARLICNSPCPGKPCPSCVSPGDMGAAGHCALLNLIDDLPCRPRRPPPSLGNPRPDRKPGHVPRQIPQGQWLATPFLPQPTDHGSRLLRLPPFASDATIWCSNDPC